MRYFVNIQAVAPSEWFKLLSLFLYRLIFFLFSGNKCISTQIMAWQSWKMGRCFGITFHTINHYTFTKPIFLQIPFEEFAYTNAAGRGASNPSSAAMLDPNMADERNYLPTDRILTVGISVLGPGTGSFELGVESIDAVNVNASDVLKADAPSTIETKLEDEKSRRETEEALERNKREPIPTPRPSPAAATPV